jgi:hypothetical protein
LGKRSDEVEKELPVRLDESDVRSALVVLTSLEASFRVDFDFRCRKRLKDDLSVYFREVERERESAVRLDEDILEGWRRLIRSSGVDQRSSWRQTLAGPRKILEPEARSQV